MRLLRVGLGGGALEGGFTLTELMVVVVIIGILAAISAPRMSRDRTMRDGTEFANLVARELQRSRMLAVSDRLPVRAYFFPNRVEIRSWTGTVIGGAVAPDPATPPARVIPIRNRVQIWNVITSGAPAAPGTCPSSKTATMAVPTTVDFNTQGGLTGATTPTYVYVCNEGAPALHPENDYRLDIAPLTGLVRMTPGW